MKIARINDQILQLTFRRFSNCYLIEQNDTFTLVDTSFPGSAPAILHAAASHGRSIRRILLTHAHADHMGSLEALCRSLGPVEVAIGEREAPLLHRDLSLRPGESNNRLIKLFFPGAKTQPTRPLADGEAYGNLRCIATPGHTPGQLSFLDEPSRTLIAGDALISLEGPLRVCTQTPWWNPITRIFTWNRQMANESAHALMRFDFETVLTGHGRPTPNGKAALAAALNLLPA